MRWFARKPAAPDPRRAAVLLAEAEALAAGGEPEAAVGRLALAAAADPQASGPWVLGGTLLAELERLDEALSSYEQALARLGPATPASAEVWLMRGGVLGRLGRYADAVASTGRAVELRPELATAHRQHGIALRHARRLPEAVVSFRRAVELDPADADVRYDCAFTLAAMGEAAAAREAFDDYLAQAPADHPRREAARQMASRLDGQASSAW